MSITFSHSGDFKNFERFGRNAHTIDEKVEALFRKYGDLGVAALKEETPKDTGDTANAWVYTIEKTGRGITLSWSNTNKVEGFPVVLWIQYGHASARGSFVPGRDFMNPAMKPIFEKFAEDLLAEVKSL